MQDRIACRLNLAPAGISRELQIQYLPEECRVITNAAEKKDCVDRYRSFAPCWNIPEGEERFACASKMLNLGASVADALRACGSGNQTNCFADVREKTYYMIKFRFYDLEQRAEALALRGADLQAVAGFETTVELKKQAFDNAKSDDERRQVILDIRAAWQNFITAVKDQVK